MTKDQFNKLVELSVRSSVQDNFINNLTDEDFIMAEIATVSHINALRPITNYTFDELIMNNNSPWISALINGVSYYLITNQISEWMHNGIDVSIDEFSVKDKMSEYQSVAEQFKENFLKITEEIKSQILITKTRPVFRKVVPSRSTIISSRLCLPYSWHTKL